jgi:thymidylate synthase (FAD)
MKVELINYTPLPDKTCAAAALGCHSESASCEIIVDLSDQKTKNVLSKTIKSGHHSVIEHANFTFCISDVSRALTHQLVRHRIASFSQQSQRYVKLSNPTFVTPPAIEGNESANKKYLEFMDTAWEVYNSLIEKGVNAEDARFVLPNATTTAITVTMNARELRHFFELRCCTRSQWEIREMAWKMLELAKKAAPVIFEGAGPMCDNCSEPNYPCDRRKKIFGALQSGS